MKKLKFYLLFIFLILGTASLGIPLGIALVETERNHPEYLSAGLLKGGLIFFIALMITVYLHETAHAIAFKIQGVKLRLVYIFPLRIVWNRGRRTVKGLLNLQLGLGGIVLPMLPVIEKEEDYHAFQKKYRCSLLAAPLLSLAVALLSLILVTTATKYIDQRFCSYFFLFFSALFIFGMYINLTSFINFGGMVGDYSAVKKLKNDEVYSLLLFYNLFLLTDEMRKKEVREKKSFLIEKIHHKVKKEKDIERSFSGISLASASLFERLMVIKKERVNITEEDIRNREELFQKVEERMPFEVYYRYLQHVVLYLKFSKEEEMAKLLWEKYQEKIPKTKAGRYVVKQVRTALYGESGEELMEECMKTSSLDSLLSGIEGYFSDEIYLNKMIVTGGWEELKERKTP